MTTLRELQGEGRGQEFKKGGKRQCQEVKQDNKEFENLNKK